MKDIERPYLLKCFYLAWQKLNHAYEDYAKQFGLTYISLFILQLINDGTTQRELCETLYFPKQTVNKVIQSFEKKGYITLIENTNDRRSRSILLTEKGKQFQNKVIPVINRAELETFALLTAEEQKTMTELWIKYTDTCVEKIENKGDFHNE